MLTNITLKQSSFNTCTQQMQLLLLPINTDYSATEKVNSVKQTAVIQEGELQSNIKAFLLQACSGPEGPRKLRLPIS
jgi:hypothetical protein